MKEVNIDNMGLVELKALAYDIIGQREENEHNLRLVNSVIAKKKEVENVGSGEPKTDDSGT